MNVKDIVMIYVGIATCLFFCVTALFILYCCYMERETAIDSSREEIPPQLRVNRIVPLTDFNPVVVMQEYEDEETSFGSSDDGGNIVRKMA